MNDHNMVEQGGTVKKMGFNQWLVKKMCLKLSQRYPIFSSIPCLEKYPCGHGLYSESEVWDFERTLIPYVWSEEGIHAASNMSMFQPHKIFHFLVAYLW